MVHSSNFRLDDTRLESFAQTQQFHPRLFGIALNSPEYFKDILHQSLQGTDLVIQVLIGKFNNKIACIYSLMSTKIKSVL
jgi:hypothetical protein